MQTKKMTLTSKTYDVDDFAAAQEFYHSNGWTDGPPVVPPTEAAVEACLEWALMPPDQLIGVEPVRAQPVTAEKLAIMPKYKFAVIGHPISSASDEQLAEYARATIEQARHLLLQA